MATEPKGTMGVARKVAVARNHCGSETLWAPNGRIFSLSSYVCTLGPSKRGANYLSRGTLPVAVPVQFHFSPAHTIRVRSSAACLNRGPLVAHVTRSSLSRGVCCASLPDLAVGIRDSRGLWPESGAPHRVAKSSFKYCKAPTCLISTPED